MSRDNSNHEILRSMRMMAWSRAKGELESMLQTYWGEIDKFSALNKEIENFTKTVEHEGLAE